jgi:gliding motility-associated-like protein
MHKILKLLNKLMIIALPVILCCSFSANSQIKQFYIHAPATMVAHPNASVSIFSDVVNAGILRSYTNSTITFYSQDWNNIGLSKIPDESASGLDTIGGVFVFSGLFFNAQNIVTQNPRPYTGFPNITIDNLQNVTAQTGNLYINNNLNFIKGNLILNGLDINVGKSGKGTITGYSEKGFVVTGTGVTGGYLVRSTTGTGALVFPIGTAAGSYTPASVTYAGAPQNLRLRVADDVYGKLGFPEYVYKTWVMATDFPDTSAKVDITLQHNLTEEGIQYSINRVESYVTRYDKNVTGLWDILPPSVSTTPSTITTGAPIPNAFMNTRTGIRKLAPIEYFSKSTIKKAIDQNTPSFIPEAISPNGDGLNDLYMIVKRQPTDVIRLEIYSRNQVLVFKDVDYKNTFDGYGNIGGFLGNRLPDGVYYYIISSNNAKAIPGYLIINR